MNSILYRCGWCGYPTDQLGNCLIGESYQKAVKIINEYGDSHTEETNGECCLNQMQDNYITVTKDMASDAGDSSLEGQRIKW